MASTVPDKLHIGVLIPEEVQLLDLAAVDLFSMLSSDYLKRCHLPEAIYQMGIPEVKIFYIAEMTAGAQQDTTAGAKIRITHSLDDEDVQPGKLDIILIPGPFPPPTTTEKFKHFVQAHFEHGNQSSSTVTTGNAPKKTEFLVVCTGSFVAGNCGILDGKNATGPRFALEDLNSLFPKAKWDGSRRWVRDGNVWTCGE
jgi:transcriptional regulator GlxA family with amidase domain